MKNTLFALALAGALMVPHATPAAGERFTKDLGTYQQDQSHSAPLTRSGLPPVPYLETMPWLEADWVWKEPHTDTKWWLDINKAADFEFTPAVDEY